MKRSKVFACLAILSLATPIAVKVITNSSGLEESILHYGDSLGDSVSLEEIETRDWFADLPQTDLIVEDGEALSSSGTFTFDSRAGASDEVILSSSVDGTYTPQLSFTWNPSITDGESISFNSRSE